MRFVYPAILEHHEGDDIVVSFRDVPESLTSGEDVAEALFEAADALEEAIAGRISRGEDIPAPSEPLPGEYLVPLPVDTAAKAALELARRASGLSEFALAKRLGVHSNVVWRMLDPREDTSVNRINEALGVLGSQVVLEVQDLSLAPQPETTAITVG